VLHQSLNEKQVGLAPLLLEVLKLKSVITSPDNDPIQMFLGLFGGSSNGVLGTGEVAAFFRFLILNTL